MNDLARFVYNSHFNLGQHPEPRDNESCFTSEFARNGQGCWVPESWIQEPTIVMKNKHNPLEKINISVQSKTAEEFEEISLLEAKS